MRPRSGLCAPLPGLVPTPSSFTCAPSLPPRAAPEPPLRGTQRLLPGLLLTPCVWGHPEGHPSEVGSVTVSRAAFLGHTHRQLAHSPSDHKSPLGPRAPWLCLGAHSLLAWFFLLTSLAGPPGAPTAWGRLFALSWGGLHGCQVQKPTGTCGASHTQHRGQHPPTALFTLDGPRVGSRAPLCVLVLNLIPVLSAGKLLSYSVPAAQRGCLFTHPSQEHRVLVDRLLQNWITDLPSMALPIRTRPSFPVGQSLPSGSFHRPLSLLHQRADRMKTTITEN